MWHTMTLIIGAFHATESGVGFTVRAGASGTARVLLALNPPHASDNGLLFQSLLAR